jgi:hypothetical protein
MLQICVIAYDRCFTCTRLSGADWRDHLNVDVLEADLRIFFRVSDTG